MNDDLISRSELRARFQAILDRGDMFCEYDIVGMVDNAPTVEPFEPDYVGAERLKARQRGYEEGYHMGMEIGKTLNPKMTHGEWIPVSERRFPDDETEVLIQYGQSMMVGYHIFDHTIYPFEYEDENETGWYDSKDDFICGSDEVIAWMPLPQPYKEADEEECQK